MLILLEARTSSVNWQMYLLSVAAVSLTNVGPRRSSGCVTPVAAAGASLRVSQAVFHSRWQRAWQPSCALPSQRKPATSTASFIRRRSLRPP